MWPLHKSEYDIAKHLIFKARMGSHLCCKVVGRVVSALLHGAAIALLLTTGHPYRYVESWKRHQALWKTEKASVMEKFKAKHPTNADFEEKLAKYAKLADDVWRQVCLLLWLSR